MKNYYQPEIETMPLDELQALQSERLVAQVQHVYENVPYYRDLMDKKGVKPEDIKGIVKCANPKCITNNEPMPTLFHVKDREAGVIRCHYCEKEQNLEHVKLVNS